MAGNPILRGFCFASLSESNWRRPRSYPQVSRASLFQLPCIIPALCWSQIAHGQFAGREDRQEANRTGCRSRYRRYIMWPMWSLVPGEDSSTGNVTGGRKLARYVLDAVVGRCGCNRLLGGCQLCAFNHRRVIRIRFRAIDPPRLANVHSPGHAARAWY